MLQPFSPNLNLSLPTTNLQAKLIYKGYIYRRVSKLTECKIKLET